MKFVHENARYARQSSSGTNVATTISKAGPSKKMIECVQLVSNFVQDLFPLATHPPQASFIGGWLWLLPNVLLQSPTLDQAAETLALGYHGKQSQSMNTVRRSYVAYDHALRLLSKALQHPRHRSTSETLCSAFILLHYEVGCPSNLDMTIVYSLRSASYVLRRDPGSRMQEESAT